MGQGQALLATCCTGMPAGALSAQIQPFQAINLVCFLVVNLLSFPPQLDMDTRATVPYTAFCDLPDTQGYHPIVTPALLVVDRSALHQQAASPADTETICLLQKMQLLKHLLVQTEVSHEFLHPLVSSSNCRRCRSFVTPRPANFFFQLMGWTTSSCKHPCNSHHSLLEIFRHTDYVL